MLGTWKTKDGRVLEISEMETKHLQAIRVMLERPGVAQHVKYWEVVRELRERANNTAL